MSHTHGNADGTKTMLACRVEDCTSPWCQEAVKAQATRENPATFQSGAKRSAPKPEWSMMPWNALREVLRRFEIGKKYGVNNWKKAQCSEDLDYVRQFDAHSFEHYREFLNLIDQPSGAVSAKGDNLIENLAAHVWNSLALLDYLLENENLVRQALSRYPEGHPKRLVQDYGLQREHHGLITGTGVIDDVKGPNVR